LNEIWHVGRGQLELHDGVCVTRSKVQVKVTRSSDL